MIIKNRAELANTGLRRAALDIIEAGIERVLPARVVPDSVKWEEERHTLFVNGIGHHLSPHGRIFVVGGGKAAGAMSESLETVVPAMLIVDGVVTCNEPGERYRVTRCRIVEAGHPVPDERGTTGVKLMLELKSQHAIGAGDIVLCLISGGGSALMPCPVAGVSLDDKQKLTGMMLSSGASISEINAVRKHLSLVKGGRLGAFFAPASVVSLVISDVVGNDLSTIASGPTYPDPTTFQDAWSVLVKYGLISAAPRHVVEYIRRGMDGREQETPKSLNNCRNYIIGDNRLALEAMARKAREMGLRPCIVTAAQTGDTAAVAQQRASELLAGKYREYNIILIGGETTPTLPPAHGVGGRNQHYAAVSMLALHSFYGEWVVASMGTDGSDYLRDVAGAIVDWNKMAAAEQKGLNVRDYLERYDSNTLLQKAGASLIVTGHTGTNVGDIIVYVVRQ